MHYGLEIQSIAYIVPMIRVLHINVYIKRKFAYGPPPEVMSEEGPSASASSFSSHARGTIRRQSLAPLHRWTFSGAIVLKRTPVLASR